MWIPYEIQKRAGGHSQLLNEFAGCQGNTFTVLSPKDINVISKENETGEV